jgi:hypothetical protein
MSEITETSEINNITETSEINNITETSEVNKMNKMFDTNRTKNEIPDFEKLKVTTMTLVLYLEGNISIEEAFGLFKVTRIDLPTPKRVAQKFKIPHVAPPGAVLSLRFRECIRGIIRSTSPTHFKNSITIDLSTKLKNVSIKLSKSKIQMCGASSVEQGIEGANYIIEHLLEIQDNLDYINSSDPSTSEIVNYTFNYVKSITKGRHILRKPYSGEELSNQLILDNKIKKDFSLDDEIINKRLAKFLLSKIDEFEYYSMFVKEMEWIRSLKEVTTRPLKVKEVYKVMVNYNYDLGFTVNRFELARRMNGLNGFFARYTNSVEHNVTVELPYEVTGRKKIRKKNKIPCHTFLIYMSGLVTQSGPGEELMRDAYYKFYDTIRSIQNDVTKPGVVLSKKKQSSHHLLNSLANNVERTEEY